MRPLLADPARAHKHTHTRAPVPTARIQNTTVTYYSRYTEEEITPCVLDLFELVKSMPTAKFQATRKKYMSSRFYKVAMIADQQVHNVRQD